MRIQIDPLTKPRGSPELLRRYEDWVSRVLQSLSGGDWDSAAHMVHTGYAEYEPCFPGIVYADQTVKRYTARYRKFGEWKRSRPTYEEALLHVCDGPTRQLAQVAQGLQDLGNMKRFMGRHADASTLFEALCELDELGYFVIGEPSSYRGALAEYYADIGEADRATRCIERAHELGDRWLAWRNTQTWATRRTM
jgi:tetratricopeptide (TPR) repeat protein